jgi:hypothetical protein
VRDDAAAAVEIVRLGDAGEPVVLIRAVAAIAHRDVGRLELAREGERIRLEVLNIDAEEDDCAVVRARGGVQDRRLVATGDAPARPEVEDDRPATQLVEAKSPIGQAAPSLGRPGLGPRPQHLERERRSGRRLARSDA